MFNSSFTINIQFYQKINRYKKIHLSLSRYTPPRKKDAKNAKEEASCPSNYQDEKITRILPRDHLQNLFDDNRIENFKCPLMLISVRNVLSNLRCLGYIKGKTEKPLGVDEEYKLLNELLTQNKNSNSSENSNSRPYHILGEKNGKFIIEEWKPHGNLDFSWFISGVPVLWEDEEYNIYQRIVTEAADHSHVWHLPRKHHPEINDTAITHWQQLQEIFTKTLMAPREEAYLELEKYAKKNKLKREENYLHNILGVDEKGKLCQLVEVGKLEDLGQKIKNLGVRRAICVDNGGSVTTIFYPKGLITGALTENYFPLVAAPNHRIPGTAYLIFELEEDSKFSFLEDGKNGWLFSK